MRWVALALVHALLVLGGVYLMLGVFGDELNRELDEEVEQVQRDLDRDFEDLRRELRREVRRELDRRGFPTVAPPAP